MNDLKSANRPTRKSGTTLIELSAVIAVLLLLVGVLFIGVTGWKNGTNTAACIIKLSSIQKATRGYSNMNGLNTGASLPIATLTSAGCWATVPVCPAGGTYADIEIVPSQGVAYISCSISGHAPSAANLANWCLDSPLRPISSSFHYRECIVYEFSAPSLAFYLAHDIPVVL